MMQLDIEYARTKNLALDLRIIFKTVPALLIQMWDTAHPAKVDVPQRRHRTKALAVAGGQSIG